MDKKDILIVDDDPRLRKTLSDILKAKGYTPITAATGKEALDKVRQEVPALALIDLKLEDMSGLEVIRGIKECSPDTECIVITGHASQESAIEAVNLGAYSYVRKPYDMEQLLLIVRRAFEKQAAAESLRESEEKFREVSASAQDGIIMLDNEGSISFWNEAAERIFDYSAQEAMGQQLHTLLVPRSHHNNYREGFSKFQATGRGPVIGQTLEVEALKKDGTELPISISVSATKIKGKWHAIGIVRDISERKRLEREFMQAQKMEAVGRLAGGVAHDFNNLLTAIIGYSDIMLMELSDEDLLRGHVSEIKKAGASAAALTQQLLTFSRKQVIHPISLDLNAVITDLNKMLVRVIGEDVTVQTVLAADLGNVNADPFQMEQVLMNLAVNARDAMPQGGNLTIETAGVDLDAAHARARAVKMKPGPYVMLAVSDTGTGMSEEIQKYIFEPFFTTKEKGRGTGLGLSTVYGIVKQNNGFIFCNSEPGKGATFKIYLPGTEGEAEPLEKEKISLEGLAGSETVLLVEDDAAVRKLVGKILKGYGYSVLEARNGQEALDVCKQHEGPIHLMLTDAVMPGMSGRELADRIGPLCPEMKILFMSGYGENVIANFGVLESGLNFIAKPFSRESLARKVREALD
ncbi:MAG: response regulator [Desulfobacterales bacterium]|nr:response regulator [Desulfobacterales bacterium]